LRQNMPLPAVAGLPGHGEQPELLAWKKLPT